MHLMARFALILFLLGGILGAKLVRAEVIAYRVSPDGRSDPSCGVDWSNPCDLQYVLTTLASAGDELWVKQGLYTPGIDRTSSFNLKEGVSILGGFAGTETSRTQRDAVTNVTVLSGEIGAVGMGDNAYHVVIGSATSNTAVLDGFTITAGNANENNYASPFSQGGGMYSDKGSPTLLNVIFSGNYAIFGGGMYNGGEMTHPNGSSPILVNVIFDGNSAIEGGGMRNDDYSNPSLVNVAFNNNRASRGGGGIENRNFSSPIVTNVTFNSNTAVGGGGIMNWDNSNPILTNVTFHKNMAEQGGGIYNENGSKPILKHVTLSGNTAIEGGALYNNYAADPSITNSILYGNSGGEIYDLSGARAVTYSIVQGGYPGIGNLDADPLLASLQDNGGFTQTMALGVGSPAIDAGENANCPETDQRGLARPQGSSCDMGAFEYMMPVTPSPIFTPTASVTPMPTQTPTATATPAFSYNPLYLSLANNQTMGGVIASDEDILRFDGSTWSLFFDGSDVGVGNVDLFAFSVINEYTILMSFDSTVTVNGLTIEPQDIVYFNATSLGSVTSGTFSMLLDGSKLGLESNAEKIDSISLSPDRRLLLSTTGDPSVPGVAGKDEDVLLFTPILFDGRGEIINGTWAMYFDGSDVGLADNSNEDIDALDVMGNNIYLSTLGKFAVNGVSGADEDIFVCEAISLGDATSCYYSSDLYFDGSTWGLSGNNVDAFNFLTNGPVPSVTPSPIIVTPTITVTPTHIS
jgi:hypothetical protein